MVQKKNSPQKVGHNIHIRHHSQSAGKHLAQSGTGAGTDRLYTPAGPLSGLRKWPCHMPHATGHAVRPGGSGPRRKVPWNSGKIGCLYCYFFVDLLQFSTGLRLIFTTLRPGTHLILVQAVATAGSLRAQGSCSGILGSLLPGFSDTT